MIKKAIALLFFVLCLSAFSQEQQSSAAADTLTTATTSDTPSKASPPLPAPPSTIATPQELTKSGLAPDSSDLKRPTVNKRSYNHREQIVFATVMMAFIAIVFTTAQNWNPD